MSCTLKDPWHQAWPISVCVRDKEIKKNKSEHMNQYAALKMKKSLKPSISRVSYLNKGV